MEKLIKINLGLYSTTCISSGNDQNTCDVSRQSATHIHNTEKMNHWSIQSQDQTIVHLVNNQTDPSYWSIRLPIVQTVQLLIFECQFYVRQ